MFANHCCKHSGWLNQGVNDVRLKVPLWHWSGKQNAKIEEDWKDLFRYSITIWSLRCLHTIPLFHHIVGYLQWQSWYLLRIINSIFRTSKIMEHCTWWTELSAFWFWASVSHSSTLPLPDDFWMQMMSIHSEQWQWGRLVKCWKNSLASGMGKLRQVIKQQNNLQPDNINTLQGLIFSNQGH